MTVVEPNAGVGLRERMRERHLVPLWELEGEIMGVRPNPSTRPWLWRWSDLYSIAERAGDLFRVYLTKVWEGWAHASAGDPGRGRRLLDEALALSVQLGTKFNLAYLKANLASSLLALGDLEPVRSLCQEAIDLAEATGEPLAKGLACRTLAEACIRLDILDRPHIEGSIQEAIRLHGDVGAQPELARTYVSYARLLDAWGETTRAQQHLQRAIAIFRQLGMAWDLTRAERALTAL